MARPTNGLHIAGPMRDLVQPCARCGAELSDYRNVQYAAGNPPLRGFEVGSLVRASAWGLMIVQDDGGGAWERCTLPSQPSKGERL